MSKHASRGERAPRLDLTTDQRDMDKSSLSKDTAFHILQSDRRRALLRYFLAAEKTSFVMRDVAERIAANEHDTTRGQLTSEERNRVYISLYQSHLPTLDDNGIISYNKERGLIQTEPLLAVFKPLVDYEEGLDAPEVVTADLPPDDSTTERGLLSLLPF